MAIASLPGVTTTTVGAALEDLETDLANLRGAGGDAATQLYQYRLWADEAARRLGSVLRAEAIERLVVTPRYWSLQSLDPATRQPQALAAFVALEVEERYREVLRTRSDLDLERKRWSSRKGLLVVADTNVYLHHESYFDEIQWGPLVHARNDGVHLVVPLRIIDEPDLRKRSARNERVSGPSSEPLRTGARVTIKRLNELVPGPARVGTLRTDCFPDGGPATLSLLMDEAQHVRLTGADDEIVDRALALQLLAERAVHLVTFDVGMKMRAEPAGLTPLLLQHQDSPR